MLSGQTIALIKFTFFMSVSYSWMLLCSNANPYKIDTDKMPAPSFMAVIIGVGQYAYKRKDGVYVIPIGCLKD